MAIGGGARIKNIGVQWALSVTALPIASGTLPGVSDAQLLEVNDELQASGVPDVSQVLLVRPTSDGDFSNYTLKLVDSGGSDAPPPGFDPVVSQIGFGFKVECPSDFDCLTPRVCPPEALLEPVIDYMTKDYESFRTLMLNRLSLLMPDWTERHAADMGNMVVEILAYVGDQLSYYQDAVATEAYLGTARQRVSVRRHARLLDYFLHDGCNSRAWVVMDIDPSVGTVQVPGGTALLTGGTGSSPLVKDSDLENALVGAEAFQTMYDVTFYSSKNEIRLYAWGDTECCLPAGATSATLSNLNTTSDLPWVASSVGDLDVKVFQWIDGPTSGALALTKFLADRYNLDWMTQWSLVAWEAIAAPGPASDTLNGFLVQALNVPWVQRQSFTQNLTNTSEVDISGTDGSGTHHTLSLTMSSDFSEVAVAIDGAASFLTIPVTGTSAVTATMHLVDIRMSDSTNSEIVISHNEHYATLRLGPDNRYAATIIDGKERDEFAMVDATDPPDRATMWAWAHTIGAGDVLIFEEVRSPTKGTQADADPAHRAAVRLTGVTAANDPLGNIATGGAAAAIATDTPPVTATPVLRVSWDERDALPFTLCLEDVTDATSGTLQPVTVARGNVVLADHGLTMYTGSLPSQGYADPKGVVQFTEFVGFTPTGAQPFRPQLEFGPLTQSAAFDPSLPAVTAFGYFAREALPDIRVLGDGEVWTPAHDLLSSGQFSPEFVVETNNDGTAQLRFGDDDYCQAPQPSSDQEGNPFFAVYRQGCGSSGNVGAEAINLVVESSAPGAGPTGFPVWVVPRSFSGQGVTKVRNPMEAKGGVDPERIEDVRQFAPQAFRVQERAVTPGDYEAVLLRYPGVKQAFAERRWTGSWWTYFISVDRAGAAPVDEPFKEEVLGFLDGYRLAGYDLEITDPLYAPLDIAVKVCLSPGFSQGDVERRLLDQFSNKILPDGTKGFFYPDNFTFGQPVYLSEVYQRALSVAGVNSVEVKTFQRVGRNPENEIANGVIQIALSEIARLDNDPDFQENGIIQFTFGGGS